MIERTLDENRPYVVIDLPPVLEAFCRWVFKTNKKDLGITASRTNVIGEALNGHLVYYSKPVKSASFINPVYFYPAITPYNPVMMEKYYPSLNSAISESFVDLVNSQFKLWCALTFYDGRAANMDQLTIIETICDILNVRMNAANFDTIKKTDYRERKTEVRIRTILALKERISVY